MEALPLLVNPSTGRIHASFNQTVTATGRLSSSDPNLQNIPIRTDLGRYIPGELVDQIVRRERDMGLGGTRREISVLFADVVGFTPMTEQLEPEHIVTILNELFTILTQIVFRHGGTVDKFLGDCVMALWGAPTEQSDHASRAVEAAEDMLSWLETGNERWQETFGVTIQLAIGVHCGTAVVGNIGSEKRMEYTAIGDVVNVAARLEADSDGERPVHRAQNAQELRDAGWADVVDGDAPRRGVQRGAQAIAARMVGRLGLQQRRLGQDLERPGRGIEQAGEDRRAVEARKAEPVDRRRG